MQTQGADPAGLATVMSELGRTWSNTPWRVQGGSYQDGVYTGHYWVDLPSESDPRAPHRPLVHGTTLYQLIEFHAGSTVMFAYRASHQSVLAGAPRLPWAELRRRFMLASVEVKLRRPVFDPQVPVNSTITHVTDKLQAHHMVFLDLDIDVADGAHMAKMCVCLNLRDDLIET